MEDYQPEAVLAPEGPLPPPDDFFSAIPKPGTDFDTLDDRHPDRHALEDSLDNRHPDRIALDDRERHDRDRAERDRSSRSDKDRSDRSGRSDRDRDRGDRDRGDRERSDRDRSDRDRDRGSRSDRDRSDRDRSERDRSDRDRGERRSRGDDGDRKRSRSPAPAREREPQPVFGRLKPSVNWDVAPVGFEHLTPMQYKEMMARGPPGMQGPPGAPPMMPMPIKPTLQGPPGNAGLLNVPGLTVGGNQQATQVSRQSRRLYVGNIPFGSSEADFQNFFNEQMISQNLNTQGPGVPVISVQLNIEKQFAFLEFRSVEETSACMAFDGISFKNCALKLRRPKDYQPQPGEAPAHVPGVVSTIVADSVNKVYVGGLPTYLNDEQVKELLTQFGALKSFNLVTDTATGLSKGFSFCEFLDVAVTDVVIAALHDMKIGDRNLVVQRAIVGAKPGSSLMGIPQMPGMLMSLPQIPSAGGGPVMPTRVLTLHNMITEQDLIEDEDYEDIRDDIKGECTKYGPVISLQIPRPVPDVTVPGLGKIFVEFASVEFAQRAQLALSGRKFAGRIVVTSYIPEDRYMVGQLA